MKIIYILNHQPPSIIDSLRDPEEYNKYGSAKYITLNNAPYWIGFFGGDWHHIWAQELLKKTDKFEVECWRPYGNRIDKIYSIVYDNILHKVFPSKSVAIKKIGYFEWSQPMLKELRNEISKNQVIIHIYDGHSSFIDWLLLNLKPSDVPVIYQHLGGSFANFVFYKTKNPFCWLSYLRQKRSLQYITRYLSGSMTEYKFLVNKLRIKNVEYFYNGIDFSLYTPGDKKTARKKLGLPIDKKLILYVGRFYSTKSVDLLIKTFTKIKQNIPNLQLLLVGGYKEDEFYQMGIDAGAIVKERTKSPLTDYYRAADVYVISAKKKITREFGGLGYASIEAMACGLPILSYNLIHFPGTKAERDKIGLTFESCEELQENLLFLLNNSEKYKECRETAQKYLDININMLKLINIYEQLFKKFYCKNTSNT